MEAIWGECGADCAMAAVGDGDEPAEIGLDEIIRWFNEEKLHESLDFDHAGSPAEAFVRKLRPKERTAYLRRLKERIA